MSVFRPPSGFRDFTPDIMLLRREVISRIERVFQRYGFDPIDTPALEYWEVLKGKYGSEAEEKLVWRFTDPWSGREYALRYDLTVSLARFMASHPGIPSPFKRYHIGKVWRHEEPQKSRYREFYQCDVDVVNSPYPEADAEILNVIIDVMEEFNFTGYTIKLNDRRLLKGVFEEELGIKDPRPIYIIIDKLDKIGREGVLKQLKEKGLSEEKIAKIDELLSVRGEPDEMLKELESKYGGNKSVSTGINHLREMMPFLIDKSKVFFDLSLVRGLEYYTGPIFEVIVEKPRIGSLAGGGRYDNLIGMFTGREMPATGTTLGVERIIDAGLELGIFKADKKTSTEIYIVSIGESVRVNAWKLAGKLRKQGFNVQVDLMRRKLGSQKEHASKLKVPIIIFLGEKEVRENAVTIYSRELNVRKYVRSEELIRELKSLLRKY